MRFHLEVGMTPNEPTNGRLFKGILVFLALSLITAMLLLLWHHERFREIALYCMLAGLVIIALVCYQPDKRPSSNVRIIKRTPSSRPPPSLS